MKVLVPKKSLADTLARVERIVPNRSSNPGLSLLRIDVTDGAMELSGSNMDVDIRAKLPADASGNGTYAVTAHVFGQVVRALPGDEVALDFGENEMQISSGSYTTKLQLMSPGSAPVLSFPSDHAGSIDGALLARALGAVRYAAAVADFQAVFRGVKIELRDSHTRAVATDGFRLAYYHLETSTGLDADVIVPARSVEELLRVVDDGEVKLQLDDGQLSVEHDGYALNLKLMDGTFPDYERVIPTAFPVSITLPAHRLSEAVARVALMYLALSSRCLPDRAAQVDEALARGAIGFKVICETFYPGDERALPTYRHIANLGKSILFHFGILWDPCDCSKYNRPALFEALMEVPKLTFALAHIGWPWTDEMIAVYGKFMAMRGHPRFTGQNMYIDMTPGTPACYRREVIERLFAVDYPLMAGRLLFGSDAFTDDYDACWAQQVWQEDAHILTEIGLSASVLQGISGNNALRFWNIA
mgnify:CR=1 FL=1